jgi:hypothetical protein
MQTVLYGIPPMRDMPCTSSYSFLLAYLTPKSERVSKTSTVLLLYSLYFLLSSIYVLITNPYHHDQVQGM